MRRPPRSTRGALRALLAFVVCAPAVADAQQTAPPARPVPTPASPAAASPLAATLAATFEAPAGTVFEVHYGDAAKLAEALPLLAGAFTIGDAPPAAEPIILEEIA